MKKFRAIRHAVDISETLPERVAPPKQRGTLFYKAHIARLILGARQTIR